MKRRTWTGPTFSQNIGFILFFILIAFAFALGPYALTYEKSEAPNFWVHFHSYGIRYVPWGLLAPVVIVLVRRFSLVGREWPYHGVVHLAISIALAFAHLAFAVLLNRTLIAMGASSLPLLSYSQFAAAYLNQSFLSYWLIVAVVVNVDSYRKYRDREIRTFQLETELTKAQLQTLKAQIEPHFLFNTLHAISGLVYRDPKTADALLSRLGSLIRANMEFSARQEIPLEREIDVLHSYNDIMLQRFGDRIKIELDIAPESRRALVPSFLLQPLVENAVRHGLGPKAEGGIVRVESRREKDLVKIRIADNGIGLATSSAEASGGGLGLANTRRRLGLIYGAQQSFAISSPPEGGVEVVIVLPFREKPEDTAEESRG